MGRLIYSMNASLDGYVVDADGRFDWAMPSPGLHARLNDLMRPIRTHLYGRRLYETMAAWETIDDPDPVMRDFAQIWRSSDKVAFSRTLERPTTARTRLERELDPAAVRSLVEAADHDVLIGGAELAGQALAAGLVDDVHTVMFPVVVGGGRRGLPDDVRLDLELVGVEHLDGGVVHLHHRVVR